jgi:hypothetical protein
VTKWRDWEGGGLLGCSIRKSESWRVEKVYKLTRVGDVQAMSKREDRQDSRFLGAVLRQRPGAVVSVDRPFRLLAPPACKLNTAEARGTVVMILVLGFVGG